MERAPAGAVLSRTEEGQLAPLLPQVQADLAVKTCLVVVCSLPPAAGAICEQLHALLHGGGGGSSQHASSSAPAAAAPPPQEQQQLAGMRRRLSATSEAFATAWAAAGAARLNPHEFARRMLQPTAELGAAMQLWWQLPRQQAEAALALAQAAATRECAFLRCANLAGDEAREAAGKTRNQVCSGCRVCRFCAGCAAPAWKAGHRRVCKALAALAAAQREAAAAE